MAMEKLGQLRALDEWDLIIVDTPPSRSALDFLDAPKRLGSFLDGRFIRLLMAPAKVGGRAGVKFLNVGMSMMTGTLSKVMGAHLLRDVQTFVAAMDSMFGGFRSRADATYKLLQANGTAFLVVAAPERDALREASYFVERLAAEDMPLAGLVLNRVHGSGAAQLTAERALAAAEALDDLSDPEDPNDPDTADAADTADADPVAGNPATPRLTGEFDESAENLQSVGIVDQPGGKAGLRTADGGEGTPSTDSADTSSPESPTGSPAVPAPAQDPDAGRSTNPDPLDADRLAAGMLRLHAERMHLVARERRTRERFVSVHPDVPMVDVAALPGDVHDLEGLRAIGERLAQGQPTAA